MARKPRRSRRIWVTIPRRLKYAGAAVAAFPMFLVLARWTREGMGTLAASNVAGLLMNYPAWNKPDVLPLLGDAPPKAAPSIINAKELGIPLYGG